MSAEDNNNPYTSFQAGVTATLRTWSALKTAVDQTWGGTESATKAEDLRRNIFSHFDGQSPNPKMTLYELEDNLGAYMEEEFGVVLEDESEREVADLIWRMYECCAKGDCALANQVVMDAIQAEELLKKSEVKSVIKNGDDDDDDDDAMNDSSEEQEIGGDDNNDAMNSSSTTPKNEATATATAPTSALEYSQGYLFGGPPKPKKELPPPRQLGEAAPETPMPVIDDDGFAPVVTKKKGARR